MKAIIKPFLKMAVPFIRPSIVIRNTKSSINLTQRPRYWCSNNKPLQPSDLSKENLDIVHEEVQVGEEIIDSFQTKGAISILNQIKGTKNAENGELYALMFTCAKCNTKAIRSFTKNAYHNGVVLIRCEGCQNVHLIADNLKWFEEEPTNLDKLSNGTVNKVHDPAAIAKFLKAAFGKSEESECNHVHSDNCGHGKIK